MALSLQVGAQIISAAEALLLVAEYQMMPQLHQNIIVEQVIADIELTYELEFRLKPREHNVTPHKYW